MKVICSYCRKFIRTKAPLDDERISHGMCSLCEAQLGLELGNLPVERFLEEVSEPALIVREDSRILAINQAMEAFLGRSVHEVRGLLGGEAMLCVYARLPDGCGRTIHCKTCTIRRAVMATMQTGEPLVDAPAHLETDQGRVELQISTVKIGSGVRITISDAKLPGHHVSG